MIDTRILSCAFDTHHIIYILDNAHCRVIALQRRTDRTHLGFRDIMTNATITNITAQTDYRFSKRHALVLRTAQQMKRKSQGGLTANARQA